MIKLLESDGRKSLWPWVRERFLRCDTIEEPQLSQSAGKETQGCLKNVPNILGCQKGQQGWPWSAIIRDEFWGFLSPLIKHSVILWAPKTEHIPKWAHLFLELIPLPNLGSDTTSTTYQLKAHQFYLLNISCTIPHPLHHCPDFSPHYFFYGSLW